LFAVVVAITALFAATEARAQLFTGFTDVPRTCNITAYHSPTVTIDAGALTNDPVGSPTGQFPLPVTCPGVDCLGYSGVGNFLRWDYRFTLPTVKNSAAYLTFSTDNDLLATSPVATVSTPGVGKDDIGERIFEAVVVRYNISAFPIVASYLTKPGLVPRVASAGVKSRGFCLIAGAGAPVGEQHQSVPVANVVRTQAGVCTIDRTLDVRGRTISMTLVSPVPDTLNQCPIALVDIKASDNTSVDAFISPDSQITFGTNSRYCFASATGGMTCVGVP
jgi:hypothetical protein